MCVHFYMLHDVFDCMSNGGIKSLKKRGALTMIDRSLFKTKVQRCGTSHLNDSTVYIPVQFYNVQHWGESIIVKNAKMYCMHDLDSNLFGYT